MTSSLAALDGHSVALHVIIGGKERLLQGQGEFITSELGNVLSLNFPADARCEVLFAEDQWSGKILSGKALGCDYLIRLHN